MTVKVGAFNSNSICFRDTLGPGGGFQNGPMFGYAKYWFEQDWPTWQFRLPEYVDIAGSTLSGGFGTQAHMDKEIQQASVAFDYLIHAAVFAADGWFNGTNATLVGYNLPMELHRTSPYKHQCKLCVNLCADWFLGPNSSWPAIIDYLANDLFTDSAYMTVNVGGIDRPLLYLYAADEFVTTNYSGNSTNARAALDALRSACAVNPYIVGIGTWVTLTYFSALGFDAGGRYGLLPDASERGGIDYLPDGEPYSAFASRVRASWDVDKAAYGDGKVVPHFSAGIDFRVTSNHPQQSYWDLPPDAPGKHLGENEAGAWVHIPTNDELVALRLAAIAYAQAHSEALICSAYAWHEPTECNIGGFCPRRGDGGSRLQAMAQAGGRQRDNRRVLRAAGYSVTTA
jgi:hypothetical protein